MAVFRLLILITALGAKADEAEDIKSLNEVESLQVFGDLVTILAKNETAPAAPDGDPYDLYLRSHVIRIKVPEEKHLDFELNDLIPGDEVEGREKRRKKGPIREILIPLLLALKHKATVVLPAFMTFVTILALKGFWAGMTGLILSKVVGLKLLLQEKHEEEQGQNQDDNDHPDDNSHDDQEEKEEPIVIFLQPHGHRRISKRYERPLGGYYGPERWDPWRRRRQLRKNKLGQ